MGEAGREHGGLHQAELGALGVAPGEVLDFSVNVTPYGPPAAVLAAARAVDLTTYPDPDGHDARVALARHVGVSPGEVVLGNGAAELMWSLVSALAPRRLLMVEPTFSELRLAAVARGVEVCEWRAAAEDDFAIDPDAIDRAVARHRPELVYLCTPNNPTGASLPSAKLAALVAAHPEVRWVVDQAFLRMSEDHREYDRPLPANAIRLRSLTKELAIPGLRIGYLVAASEVTAALASHRPPWTVNGPALAAAIASTREDAFVAASRERLLADRARLETGLRARGFHVVPSRAPFVLAEVDDATAWRRRLLRRHRILVRDGSSFGLPRAIRLAARPATDTGRLLAALEGER